MSQPPPPSPLDAPRAGALRPASQVMRLSHLGAMMPTRLSFMRSLLRRLNTEGAEVKRPVWEIDRAGYGRAVYSVSLGGRAYSLVAISAELPADQRTDRVIATAWDAAFVLYDGVPDAREVDRIAANAPHQEAGRFSPRDLVLSRANKSVRLFAHVVERLRSGQQPEAELIRETGYLMRTTAVYGNGKFGIADREVLENRPGLTGPFAAEMLTVWLIRGFTHDLAEHLGGAEIAPALKRHLGIGNSTGLGMAPFLVSHPMLLNNWIMVLETARARVLARQEVTKAEAVRVQQLHSRAALHLAEWAAGTADMAPVAEDWAEIAGQIGPVMAGRAPFAALCDLGHLPQTKALLTALALEVNGPLIDGLTDCMGADHEPRLDGAMECTELAALIDDAMGWAVKLDYETREEAAQFWYVSEEKLEPRLGLRFDEPGAERESPLDVARRVKALRLALDGQEGALAAFLMRAPQHRFAARRVQTLKEFPYAEIQDNLISARLRPIDMLRAKLSLFGAAKFDPRSDRWVRVTLAQGAPLASEITKPIADDWWLAGLPQ